MILMMESHEEEEEEEAVVCKDHQLQAQQQIMKGKRTKRQRPVSPLTLAMASSSTTTNSSDHQAAASSSTSTTTSVDEDEEEEEEDQDMAYCLMLLAQGHHHHHQSTKQTEPGSNSLFLHQCKTCDRSFSSFQALGGHRASHNNKPKLPHHHDTNTNTNANTTLSLRITHKAAAAPAVPNNKSKSKVHECSICGAEFSSGQALGGHMRKHRTITTTRRRTEDQLSKKPRTVLQLDLNLPAPEDDHHKGKKLLVFSSSNSLVDCHY